MISYLSRISYKVITILERGDNFGGIFYFSNSVENILEKKNRERKKRECLGISQRKLACRKPHIPSQKSGSLSLSFTQFGILAKTMFVSPSTIFFQFHTKGLFGSRVLGGGEER
jgi:hypothetical protein